MPRYAALALALFSGIAQADDLTPYVFTKFSAGLDYPAGASVGTETVSGLFELGADHKSGFGVYANYYIADSKFGTFSTTFVGVSYKFYSPLDALFK